MRRIPEGLEIEGLREGLSRMIREYEIQHSISYGVARVLRGEVSAAQNTLRSGQRKAVKFAVVAKEEEQPNGVAGSTDADDGKEEGHAADKPTPPGHCVGCQEAFTEAEQETLVGFACGHVFHLSHLLSYNHRERPPSPPTVELNEYGEFVQEHSIGAKVTHARLLRDQISGGCPACHEG